LYAGIFINFTNNKVTDLENYSTTIERNKIVGGKIGIQTFGQATEQDVLILNNTIINAKQEGIVTDLHAKTKGIINIIGNRIIFNNASLTARKGISPSITTLSGTHEIQYNVERNIITFEVGSGAGFGVIMAVDKSYIANNMVYGNGNTWSYSNNGFKTVGVQSIGNRDVNSKRQV
jgi:hypothetical protein